MQRFKRFIGKQVISENLKNLEKLSTFGVICRNFPESLDGFEEIEFSVASANYGILLCIAVLEGKVKRIMFVQIDKDDPDAFRPLTEEQLIKLLEEHGERLISYFEYITQ